MITINNVAIVKFKRTITRHYKKTRRNKFAITINSCKCEKVTFVKYAVASVRYKVSS